MENLVLQALSGLASASSLFLVASGLTVIFGVSRVVNSPMARSTCWAPISPGPW
ncbi:hypothetical protein [Paeniroseomonas aquatica]